MPFPQGERHSMYLLDAWISKNGRKRMFTWNFTIPDFSETEYGRILARDPGSQASI